MITKVLLVDPSIGFAVGIKRALEQPGGYRVMTFANGQAALDLVRAEPQDLAILDFEPDDMDIVSLIAGLREIQPGLPILVSPRTAGQTVRVPSLNISGSINKPYLVRQLIPVIRETLAARSRQNAATAPLSSPPPMEPVEHLGRVRPIESSEYIESAEMDPSGEPAEWVEHSEPPAEEQDTPPLGVSIMHGSDDFDAALAALTPTTPPMFPEPDDNFHRHLSALQANAPVTTAGLRKTLENFAMPPNDEDSTLAEVIGAVTGLPTWPAQSSSDLDSGSEISGPPIADLVESVANYRIEQESIQPEPPGPGTPTNPPGSPTAQPRPPNRPPISELLEPETPTGALESVVPVDPMPPPDITNIEPSFVAALTAVPSAISDPMDDWDEPDDVDSAAEIAARLTHLAIQSTAYATILTRSGLLVASAGELSARGVAGVVETIAQIWQTADEDDAPSDDATPPPRIRYIQVPGVGDFALYSIRTIDELYLSVLFPADTSLRLIRQQARRLIAALEQGSVGASPETRPGDDEPDAAKTQMSRPTEPLVPNGWRETMAEQGLGGRGADGSADQVLQDRQNQIDMNDEQPTNDQAEIALEVPQAPPTLATIPDVPYSPYTLLWLPQAESSLMDIADQLPGWIHIAAAARAWKVAESTVSAGCVSVRIDLPADQTPRGAIDALQRAITERANESDLWTEGYYVIASERAVTPFEIAQFVDYRRPTSGG